MKVSADVYAPSSHSESAQTGPIASPNPPARSQRSKIIAMSGLPAPTHAGGVVVRDSPSGPLYLIVEARREPGVWVLPKGHINDGETPEEAAVREVEEEAGCHATIVEPIGAIRFGDTRVAFFLMKYQHDVPRTESRGLFWGAYDQARERLSFGDTQALLARVHAAPGRQ
jgi:8-oxo-dGTP pyrophosphatase MutT (NUDIX family)